MNGAAYDDLLGELAAAAGAPWCLLPAVATALSGVLADVKRGRDVAPARLRQALAGSAPARADSGVRLVPSTAGKSLAIVPIHGIATWGLDFPPYAFSLRRLARTMRELAADASIAAAVLDFATPGGVGTGLPEAGDAIFAARRVKPIMAIADPLAASAGYWLASQASVIAVTPSGGIGSVGVFVLHVEISEALKTEGVKPTFVVAAISPHKTEFNMLEPLSDEAAARAQLEVDTMGGEFLKAIARGRGKPASEIRAKFGGGRLLMPREALAVGMVDSIATFESFFVSPAVGARSAITAGAGPGGLLSDPDALRRRLRLEALR